MRISEQGLQDRGQWENKGYALPLFDRAQVKKNTVEAPFWVHFGGGNLFRAFQANAVQRLLNQGLLDRGLIVAEGYDPEIVEKMNRPHDDLHVLVTLKADGSVEKTVVGSVVESLALDPTAEADIKRLREIFASASLQMTSFTITEKGYAVADGAGALLPAIAADLERAPEAATSYMGKVTALLHARYLAGGTPIAMVSMDNCSHNGDKLKAAVLTVAEGWEKKGLAKEGFVAYLQAKVSFPWTMIDKITPRPDAAVEEMLRADGLEETGSVVTSKNTYVAPFVNAEETEYLVIEDDFPNGRPAVLEQAGLLFTSRETVERVERMKVCTCLNPLHTALAIFGCILGHQKISEEMKDEELLAMVQAIGYKEGLPVVTHPGVLDPKEFIDTVVEKRLPNPFMPDTPQRIATDTSQKLAIRFGETVKAYAASAELDPASLEWIPLVFAGWLRYLLGVNDAGESFEISPDPMLEEMKACVKNWKLGEAPAAEEVLPLLQNERIFGVDLTKVGLSEKVLARLNELMAGKGAVRATLRRVRTQTEASV